MDIAAQRYQVVVAGGGSAGWVAALAAARAGARVLILERRHHLGGNLASGLPILGFFNTQAQQIVRGIPDAFVGRLTAAGGTDGYQILDLWQSSQVSLEPVVVKCVIQAMLEEAGAEFLFDAQVSDAVMQGDRLVGVEIQKRSGREIVFGDVFIDATGDAELAYRAGAPIHLGDPATGAMQPPTLLVRLLGVDVPAMRAHLQAHPEDYVNWRMRPGKTITSEFLARVPLFLAFTRQLQAAREAGDFDATIDRVMFSAMPFDRSICVNMLRPYGVDGTRSESITAGLRQLRPEVLKLERFFRKYIPGCADAYAADVDPELLSRETRRIVGEYALTAEDVLAGRQFPDSIGLGGYYIDVHNANDPGCACVLSHGTYGIPYRCLLPQKVEGLLVAGRTISGTPAAAGSFRVMATCMAIGQGAGVAAALAAQAGVAPRRVSIERLRDQLVATGALVDAPPA